MGGREVVEAEAEPEAEAEAETEVVRYHEYYHNLVVVELHSVFLLFICPTERLQVYFYRDDYTLSKLWVLSFS